MIKKMNVKDAHIGIYVEKSLVMKMNDRQEEAVYKNLDKNVLVAAAAGSGKTRVLVERILYLLSDKKSDASLSNMVIMTFTNKATSEMKKRIKERLESAIKNDITNIKLIKESSLIQNAKISTIDSFCKHLLDENYSALLDFDPSYRMAENKELGILYDDVLDTLLEEKYADKYYKSLFDMFYVKNDTMIRQLLLDGLKFLSSIPWEIDFLKNRIDNFDEESKIYFKMYKDDVYLSIIKLMKPLLNINKAIEILDAIESASLSEKKTNKTTIKLIGLRDYFKNVLENAILDIDLKNENLTEENIMVIADLLDKENLPDISRLVGDFYGYRTDYDDIIIPILNLYYKKTENNIFEIFRLLNEATDDYIINVNEKKLLELLLEFSIRVTNEKKKKNVISISDPQKMVLDILYEKKDGKCVVSDKANEIANSYKYIFVDEYQDTNIIQELILTAISCDFNNKNVFMVGDIKQSIYRFRNADPTIFADKFSKYIKKNDTGVVTILDTNYRSEDNILKFVNYIFSKMMFKEYGDIDYIKNDMLGIPSDSEKEELKEKRKYDFDIDNKVEVKVLCSDDKERGKKDIEKEASYVTNLIREYVDKGASYKDIVILLSTIDNKASYFIDALSEAGIPSYAELKKGFYDRFEIKLMIDILNIIDNPLQDIPLASVIMSSIYSVNNKELAYIKINYDKFIEFGKNEEFRLYDAIKYVAGIEDTPLGKKLNRFLKDIDELMFRARYMSISELITYIYDEMNVYNIISSMDDGKLRAANLEILYKNAKGFENSSYVGLFNFLRYVQKIVERKDDEGMAKAYDENDNIVKIMTIHSSKGLEFPIVILADANKEYNMTELKNDYIYDIKLGTCLDYVNEEKRYAFDGIKKSIAFAILRDKIIEEQIRVLYVALTRAKRKLVITGFANKEMRELVSCNKNINIERNIIDLTDEKKEEYIEYMRNNRSFMKLIVRFFPYGADYCDIEIVSVDANDISKIQKYDDNILDITEEKAYINVDDLKNDIEYMYKYDYLNQIKPKLSVTMLKKEANACDFVNNYRDGYDLNESINEDKDRKDGTVIGNAYHRFMQFYNFSNEKVIEDNVVDNNKIEEFASSNLGKKMAMAYRNKTLYREHKFMKLFSQDEINKYFKNNDVSCDEKNVVMQGIIDAFFVEKESDGSEYIVLVDYKTDKLSVTNIGDIVKFKNYLIENYKVQLEIYSKVLAELTGMPVKEKYIYSFAIGEEIKV